MVGLRGASFVEVGLRDRRGVESERQLVRGHRIEGITPDRARIAHLVRVEALDLGECSLPENCEARTLRIIGQGQHAPADLDPENGGVSNLVRRDSARRDRVEAADPIVEGSFDAEPRSGDLGHRWNEHSEGLGKVRRREFPLETGEGVDSAIPIRVVERELDPVEHASHPVPKLVAGIGESV